ncbi:hypothetical protein QQF64_016737 [Cirrhinus molitorella]|uniref:HAT C-terminal dimerisation domain-containing protein n=1 Tax=Cirrhinus molitorella TaxID=172907 RepID=A0ABR3LST2_9TELE
MQQPQIVRKMMEKGFAEESQLLLKRERLIQRTTSTAERLAEASFEIAWILAQGKKPFSDAEIVKDCFLASTEILFAEFDNNDVIRAAVESEIIELQTKDILKDELRAGVGHFWSLVSEEDFLTLKPQKVMSCFVSTYTCESTFSTMNTIRRKQRNSLTKEHLECLTRIATTSYKYNMKKSQGNARVLPIIPALR